MAKGNLWFKSISTEDGKVRQPSKLEMFFRLFWLRERG